MVASNIRYSDVLDYAEKMMFSGNRENVEKGKNIMELIEDIDYLRGVNGNQNEKFLTEEEVDLAKAQGFKTEDLWAHNKDGKSFEYGSPLSDYQEAYIEYMANPFDNREKNFEELKTMEVNVTAFKEMGYVNYLDTARGLAKLSMTGPASTLAEMSAIKQSAYGRHGLNNQLKNVYAEVEKLYGRGIAYHLATLEHMLATKDMATNNAKLYATCEISKDTDGKPQLLYTINAPSFSTNAFDNVKVEDNEAVTFKITDKGIEGAKYTDFNFYYDELEVEVPSQNIGSKETDTIIKKGKKAAEWLKANPTEDYPDPSKIQYCKVENTMKWVYVLPDMSYPEKEAKEPFTTDFEGVRSSIASDRLKEVCREVEKMIDREQPEIVPWNPKDLKTLEKKAFEPER